jgi:hypothetical protein
MLATLLVEVEEDEQSERDSEICQRRTVSPTVVRSLHQSVDQDHQRTSDRDCAGQVEVVVLFLGFMRRQECLSGQEDTDSSSANRDIR